MGYSDLSKRGKFLQTILPFPLLVWWAMWLYHCENSRVRKSELEVEKQLFFWENLRVDCSFGRIRSWVQLFFWENLRSNCSFERIRSWEAIFFSTSKSLPHLLTREILHLQTIASHLSQIEEWFLPREKIKEKITKDVKVKPVLIKTPIYSYKGFNTSSLNEKFLEKLTKTLGGLKITDSIKVIHEESDNLEELLEQFTHDKIDMAKPIIT